MKKGELTLIDQYSAGFGAAKDFFYKGQNIFYRNGDAWYLGHTR
jgi:hypothetical protein